MEATLNAVKHLLWCGEDGGGALDREHCDQVCTAVCLQYDKADMHGLLHGLLHRYCSVSSARPRALRPGLVRV